MRKVKFVSSNDREAALLSLEEAAQEIADKMALLREVLKADALACLSETHQQLGEQLGEVGPKIGEQLGEEYEFIGTINGTYGGRWTLASFAENWSTAWPDNTAVYVRRGSPPKIGEQLGEQELKANVTSKFLEWHWHAEVVKLAVLAEREACARVVETLLGKSPELRLAAVYVAAEIRERGQDE